MSRHMKILVAAVLVLGAGYYAYWRSAGADGAAHHFASDSTECVANLRAIYAALLEHVDRNGRTPTGSGVTFLAELYASGVWPADEEHARKLTCPGVPLDRLALSGKPLAEWFADPSAVDGGGSAYAARDQAAHPLPQLPGNRTEALVACDNAAGPNHPDVTNVLMADGTVVSLELAREIEMGNLPDEATRIVVGPDSPLRELRTLSLD